MYLQSSSVHYFMLMTLGTSVVVILVFMYREHLLIEIIPSSSIKIGWIWWSLAFIVTFIFLLAISGWCGVQPPDIRRGIILYSFIIFYNTVAEELLFRGLIFNGLRLMFTPSNCDQLKARRKAAIPAGLISSFVFASFHYPHGIDNIEDVIGFSICFIPGIVWALFVYWSNIYVTMGSHAGWNVCYVYIHGHL